MLGEYRNIMNLCRVLPGGTEAKLAVDDAIDACHPIGNFREDIFRCAASADNAKCRTPNSSCHSLDGLQLQAACGGSAKCSRCMIESLLACHAILPICSAM